MQKNGQGIPLIGGDQLTQAKKSQQIVEVTAALKGVSSALGKQGSHGQIMVSFFQDGSYSVVTIGAVGLPHLVSASIELSQQVSQAMQVALQQIGDHQRAMAAAATFVPPKA